jgi:hypothetical protein
MRVLQSVGDFAGTLEFHDVSPIEFRSLLKFYNDGVSKDGIIAASNRVIRELDDDIKKLNNGRS